VGYDSDGHVYQLTLESPAIPTARGLRVGDPEDRVRGLYGPPADTAAGAWEDRDPSEATGHHVMRVAFKAGHVINVFLGTLLD
jgi:hypothetical protein